MPKSHVESLLVAYFQNPILNRYWLLTCQNTMLNRYWLLTWTKHMFIPLLLLVYAFSLCATTWVATAL